MRMKHKPGLTCVRRCVPIHRHSHLCVLSRPVKKMSATKTSKKSGAAKTRIGDIGAKGKVTASHKRPPKPAAKTGAGRHKPLSAGEIDELFSRFAAANPHPKGELESVNPYTLLVAVVLSAQATDAGVNRATRPLFKIADTPQKMLDLGEDTVRDFIKTIGLYRNKAKNVIALSQRLVDEYGGAVPNAREALEALPGVGRKTANVVLNIAFGEATLAVDTHVFRVAHRVGLSSGKTPVMVENDLMRLIPERYMRHAHHWLILHGRYLCKARKPECWHCPIAEICRFEPKTPAPKS